MSDRIVAAVDDLEAAGDMGKKPLGDLPDLGTHGGDRKSEQRDQVDNVNLPAGGGNNSTYLARRIKRSNRTLEPAPDRAPTRQLALFPLDLCLGMQPTSPSWVLAKREASS